ncbi:MAG: alcohol dehydrogenase catalytic domain-containing protein [Anaerolineae bacterium]|nr:alcohol dehydrogenase catalytic domain-containing protein [Anaerolineae bacterium]MDW8100756.1 alcohol dehydrogenase catalytic domain-containing protein [Anaerolineae bacterium]
MGIPKTMKAVRVHGIQDYRLEEVPVPPIGPGEVLIRVLATGICASDVKTFYGARVWGSEEIAPYIEVPVTPGHEFVGQVVALGEGAAEKYGLAIGDMAVSEQIVPCWQCRFCRRGQYWMCQRHDIYGFKKDRAEGAWAEYMRFPANAINHKVPSDLLPEHAALIEPLACAIHAVERGNIQLGDVVVIAGMGPIGLCMLQVAKQKGPGMLIALDAKPKRLMMAKELGADLAIDVTQGDAVQRVLDLTDGYGCDVYIEATGAGAAVAQGLQMIRRLGTFVEFSVHAGPVAVDWSIIGDVKELNIHGAHLGPYCYPLAIEYLRKGVVDGEALVTHRLPLDRFAEGLELAHCGDESIKVVLIP